MWWRACANSVEFNSDPHEHNNGKPNAAPDN
jgi:hypothetical protein